MLVLICGKSGTGKTAVSKLLQDKYHWRRITTCTTRPKRQNETNEYILMDNDVFDIFMKKDQFVEVTEYNATYGLARYGTLKWIIEDAVTSNLPYVLVVDPAGLKHYKEVYPDRTFAIRFDAKDEHLTMRLLGRGDRLEEIKRRLFADAQDLKIIDEVDIVNIDANLTIEYVAEKVVSETKLWYHEHNIEYSI